MRIQTEIGMLTAGSIWAAAGESIMHYGPGILTMVYCAVKIYFYVKLNQQKERLYEQKGKEYQDPNQTRLPIDDE